MEAVTPPLLNLHQELVACGINSRHQSEGKTAAEKIAEEVFGVSFSLMMHIHWKPVRDPLT